MTDTNKRKAKGAAESLQGASDMKIKEMRKDVQDTQKIMEDNVERLINRAELLERLDLTTKDLRGHTQEFALKSNELKTSLQTRHYIYKGIMLFGATGILYGLYNGYSLGGSVAVGLFGSTVGGTVGYYAGTIKGFFNRLSFAYQLQDSPLTAIKGKLGDVFQRKMKPLNTHTQELKQKVVDTHTPNNPIEKPSEPLEISKTLTQWFETQKQEKQQNAANQHVVPSKKHRNSLKID